METLKKILSLIRNLPLAGKIISTIIVLLISILLIFFNAGCAMKFHADSIDNVTYEHMIDK